jgi:hypothetical protein
MCHFRRVRVSPERPRPLLFPPRMAEQKRDLNSAGSSGLPTRRIGKATYSRNPEEASKRAANAGYTADLRNHVVRTMQHVQKPRPSCNSWFQLSVPVDAHGMPVALEVAQQGMGRREVDAYVRQVKIRNGTSFLGGQITVECILGVPNKQKHKPLQFHVIQSWTAPLAYLLTESNTLKEATSLASYAKTDFAAPLPDPDPNTSSAGESKQRAPSSSGSDGREIRKRAIRPYQFIGERIRWHFVGYEYGWHTGTITSYDRRLNKYKVEFPDGTPLMLALVDLRRRNSFVEAKPSSLTELLDSGIPLSSSSG